MANLPCNEIAIDQLDLDTSLRGAFPDLDELMLSIQKHGVRVPIIISPKETGGYSIVNGYRRVLACHELGLPVIKSIIYDDLSPREQRSLSLELDITHRDMKWQERAKAIKELYALKLAHNKSPSARFGLGYTQEMFAKDINLSTSAVCNYLALSKTIDDHPEILQYTTMAMALQRMRDLRNGIFNQVHTEESFKECFIHERLSIAYKNAEPIYQLIITDIRGHLEDETLDLVIASMAEQSQAILFVPIYDYGKLIDLCRSKGLHVDPDPYFWTPAKESSKAELFIWVSNSHLTPPRTISRNQNFRFRGSHSEYPQDRPYDFWYYFYNRLSRDGDSIFLPHCYSIKGIRAAKDLGRNIFAFNSSILIYENLFLIEDHSIANY